MIEKRRLWCCAEENQAVAPCKVEWLLAWMMLTGFQCSLELLCMSKQTHSTNSGSNTPWAQWPEFDIEQRGGEWTRQWQTNVCMTWIWLVWLCMTFTWPEYDLHWKNIMYIKLNAEDIDDWILRCLSVCGWTSLLQLGNPSSYRPCMTINLFLWPVEGRRLKETHQKQPSSISHNLHTFFLRQPKLYSTSRHLWLR